MLDNSHRIIRSFKKTFRTSWTSILRSHIGPQRGNRTRNSSTSTSSGRQWWQWWDICMKLSKKLYLKNIFSLRLSRSIKETFNICKVPSVSISMLVTRLIGQFRHEIDSCVCTRCYKQTKQWFHFKWVGMIQFWE